jgi:hypothetical protein
MSTTEQRHDAMDRLGQPKVLREKIRKHHIFDEKPAARESE